MKRRQRDRLAVSIVSILADLDEPWSTGQICDVLAVLAPIKETRRVRHGRQLSRKIRGTDQPAFEECPTCHCTEEWEISRPYMATPVRQVLKRLKESGLVIEIDAPVPNNDGGNLWLLTEKKDAYYARMFA